MTSTCPHPCRESDTHVCRVNVCAHRHTHRWRTVPRLLQACLCSSEAEIIFETVLPQSEICVCVYVCRTGVSTEGHHGKFVYLRSYKQMVPSECKHIKISANILKRSLESQSQLWPLHLQHLNVNTHHAVKTRLQSNTDSALG